ncbi:tRNA epoxyqueuosine(34) reductase QueG [bacterium]|nr:tRNA epoxyqueuosine(34) reductase QueG [bacterium]
MGSLSNKQIKDLFFREGFSAVGFLNLEDSVFEGQYLKNWIKNGYHATMKWMEDHQAIRENPCRIVDAGKSIIAAAFLYKNQSPENWGENNPISNYAWGEDYHTVLKKKLTKIMRQLEEKIPDFKGRAFVDTAPIPEKLIAARSGLGWVGKNSMLINRKLGSYLFLGEIVCDLDLPSDTPAKNYCGTCRKCIDHCPTGAILENGIIDSRRCVSYLTIEKRGDFIDDEKKMIDYQLFGCDICQQVCPWNKKAPFSPYPGFSCAEKWVNLDMKKLATISSEEYDLLKVKSPIKRARLEGLKRNASLLQRNKNKE